MMDQDDGLVGRLLDAARNDVASDEVERQAQLHSRVASIGPRGPGGGGTGSGPGVGGRGGVAWLRIAAVGAGVAALALLGSSALRSSSPAAPTPVNTAAPAASFPSAPPPSPLASTAPAATGVWELPSVTAEAAPHITPAPSVADDPDTLAADLAALEGVRRQLRAGDASSALGGLDDLGRRSPRSRVRDEATVLRIEVLGGLGRAPEARRLAERFLADHPGSIYAPRIARSLGDQVQ